MDKLFRSQPAYFAREENRPANHDDVVRRGVRSCFCDCLPCREDKLHTRIGPKVQQLFGDLFWRDAAGIIRVARQIKLVEVVRENAEDFWHLLVAGHREEKPTFSRHGEGFRNGVDQGVGGGDIVGAVEQKQRTFADYFQACGPHYLRQPACHSGVVDG